MLFQSDVVTLMEERERVKKKNTSRKIGLIEILTMQLTLVLYLALRLGYNNI